MILKIDPRRFFSESLIQTSGHIKEANEELGRLDVNPNDITKVKEIITILDKCANLVASIGEDIRIQKEREKEKTETSETSVI